ncbi:MAG TPA: serine hydrolase domain-containing protein [Saprospiraceae bacterium]|nr:serine hydrolase domain-containing protein [Saprospiraceae bacterium]
MKSIYRLLSFFILGSNLLAQPNSIPREYWLKAEQFLSQQKDASGFFLVGAEGKIMMEKGLDFANREQKINFDDNTLYSIGSITKSFTATAILLLMERGLINVQDPISMYFYEIPNDKKEITLHQLLTHTSGFPGAIGDDYEIISKEDFQQRAWNTPLLFVPGKGYSYSNVGYSLLGMIIEKVSGENYSAFLENNIFKPAGMTTAGYHNPNADYKKLAHGYFQDGGDWGTAKDKKWDGNEPSWHLKANGGILMSATDLFHWYLALRNHTLLRPETLKLQTTPHVREGEDESYYGYGYAVSPDGEVVQHNGGNRIFKADFRWYPKSDMVLISVSNDANTRLFRINDQIMDILMTGKVPETINWDIFELEKFPNNPQQETAKKFIDLLQHYSASESEKFISLYFTSGIMERNTKDRIDGLFEMLSQAIGQGAIQKVESSADVLQVTVPAADGRGRMRIKLNFIGEKIDRIGAEME